MAIIDALQHDEQPVGAGNHGILKVFMVTLAAATPKVINFGKFFLKDAANVFIQFGVGTNGPGDAFQGLPDTTTTIAADGKSMTLTDAAGGDFSVLIIGEWGIK